MVDEAQKALEEAEALKKVCVFSVVSFLFGTYLRVTSHLIGCGDFYEV